MSQELNVDLTAWWEEQSFPGKELFNIDATGTITLLKNSNVPERVVATVSPENRDSVVKNLTEKFAAVQSKVDEMEVEWMATEDKARIGDKVIHLKEHLNQVHALGDFRKLAERVHAWEHIIYKLYEEHYAIKLALTEQAEALAESDQWKETTAAFKEIAEKWKQAGMLDKSRNEKLWNRVEAAKQAFYDRKRVHHQEEEKDLLVNLDLKIDLVEQAESLAMSEEWKKTTETFHRLTTEWKGIGHTLNKKNEELWQRFLAAKSTFFERKREHSKTIEQELEQNYIIKQGLVEKAEALKESTEWNVATQAYAALMDEWKKTGRVPQEKGDELWNKFTEARDHFFTAKRKHTEEIRNSQEHNYTQKKALMERAEQIKNSSAWGEVTNEMNELMDEWKKLGNAGKEHNEKLWERFLGARKTFFGRKDANREQRKQHFEQHKAARVEQAHNMVYKLERELVEEEEKLADFKNGLDNITPGKKADELRTHLETLIADSNQKMKRLAEKLAAAKDEVEAMAKAEAAAAAKESTEMA
jgi:hypothetical protein